MNDSKHIFPLRQAGLAGIFGVAVFVWAWTVGDELYIARAWFWSEWYKTLPGWLSWAWRNAHYIFYLAFALIAVQAYRNGDKEALLACLVYLVAQLLIALLLVRVLKMSIGRPRPFLEYQGPAEWRPWAWSSQYESIPSGHSTDAAVGFGTTIAFFSSKLWRVLALLLLLVVMASRMVQGQHHPSDVIAGGLIGYLGSLILGWGVRKYLTRKGKMRSAK